MESTTAPPATTPSDPEPQAHAPAEPRPPTNYAVYRATGDDVDKEGVASQLNLVGKDVKAKDELEARWKVIDNSEEMTKIVNDGGHVDLVAIPMRRALAKRTRLDRKVDERRV